MSPLMNRSLTCKVSVIFTWSLAGAWNLSLPFGALTPAVSNRAGGSYQNGNNLSTCQQLLTLILSLDL